MRRSLTPAGFRVAAIAIASALAVGTAMGTATAQPTGGGAPPINFAATNPCRRRALSARSPASARRVERGGTPARPDALRVRVLLIRGGPEQRDVTVGLYKEADARR